MKESVKKSFWFNLLIVSGVFIVIYIIFFLTLSIFTHHGEQVKIPNLKGKTMEEAIATLHNMHFEVHVDSTFEPTVKPLRVLKQVPDTGSIVKTGRIVMITVNSVTPMRVPMPNLVNLSYRSAEMLLKNNKMFVGDTTYVPDIARGAIKEQRYKGQAIRPGEMIPQGSKIDLVIGNGLGNTEWDVPDLTRMTVDAAMSYINQYNLVPNLVIEELDGDIISDTAEAYIVKQNPPAYNDENQRNKIRMGDVIDLYIKQHPKDEDYNGGQGNMKSGTPVKEPFDPDEDK